MSLTLNRALLLLLGGALVVSLLPAGLALDRRLVAELESKARMDLALAGPLLEDRNVARAEVLKMHATQLASSDSLAAALSRADSGAALALVAGAHADPGEEAVVVDRLGTVWTGPVVGPEIVRSTQDGEVAAGFVAGAGTLHAVALAPVGGVEGWSGAVGVAQAVDAGVAGTLSGLTRSDVVILTEDGTVVASTLETVDPGVVTWALRWRGDGEVHEIRNAAGGRHWMGSAPLGDVGAVAFLRDAQEELAILPRLRWGALLAGTLALGLALALGAVISMALARPFRNLAEAADRLAQGDFGAPLERSAVAEADRMSRAFGAMRKALSQRLVELQEVNRELADRQERLGALQSELIQRDRLVASGRLVAELAHEIRNPVANVRNCLEVVRRRAGNDAKAVEFADLAIDELLRMHELAEQMLDLHRPMDPDAGSCRPAEVARSIAALVQAGAQGSRWRVTVRGDGALQAAIAPDSLKQVLLNLVQNAREAMGKSGGLELRVCRDGDVVAVEVEDSGHGIPEEILPRVFDPFFTTKGEVHGVGLGLFVADGIVRRYGGRILASNRTDGEGAVFRIELKPAGAADPPREVPA